MKITLVFLMTLFWLNISAQQVSPTQLTNQEKLALFSAIQNDSLFASRIRDTSNAIELYKQFKINVNKSDSSFEGGQQRLHKIGYFGYTNKFELIPLVESLYGNTQFKKGSGVSYLIRTDSLTILFDTGIDSDSLMCVLRYNMDIIGIDISEIDIIFISHNHADHQNNWKWINDKTFVNPDSKSILPEIEIYVPEDELNIDIAYTFSNDPLKIGEGVYTTGIIKAPFFFNSTQEQGLIFNIKDKGAIIVTGCGHQTIEKLFQRYDILSDIPLYGILGGLHFPVGVTGYYNAGRIPWEPFTLSDINKKIDYIRKQNIELIGVSTHDSSRETIEAFKAAFSKEYKDLRTGDWLTVK